MDNNLGAEHPHVLAHVSEITGQSKFTILFKLPEGRTGDCMTLVGLDRDGKQIISKEIGQKH